MFGPADRNRTCISRLGGMRTIHCATASALHCKGAPLTRSVMAQGKNQVEGALLAGLSPQGEAAREIVEDVERAEGAG